MHRWGGSQAFPSVITVFSAPNYCQSYKNKGAVILIENDKMNIKQYKDVEQPFALPNNLDLFSWSLPFLSDKIHEMMDHLLKKNELLSKERMAAAQSASKEEFGKILDEMKTEKSEQERQRMNKIKAKVLTIARFNLMLKKHNENADVIKEAKKMYPSGKLPVGAIFAGLDD